MEKGKIENALEEIRYYVKMGDSKIVWVEINELKIIIKGMGNTPKNRKWDTNRK